MMMDVRLWISFFGGAVVVLCFTCGLFWISKGHKHPTQFTAFAFLGVFLGMLMIYSESVVEFQLGGLNVKLDRLEGFVTTAFAAITDSREAFDKLDAWARDPSHPYSERARAVWNTVVDDHELAFLSCRGVPNRWDDAGDQDLLTFEQLQTTFASLQTVEKPGALSHIRIREDIPLRERMEFYIQVMRTDQSLNVKDRDLLSGSESQEASLRPWGC